jgi:hypothetical protein
VSAKKIIDKYRDAAQPVVQFWQLCQELIQRSLFEGRPYHHKCLQFEKEKIILPNGMALKYPLLKGNADEKSRLQPIRFGMRSLTPYCKTWGTSLKLMRSLSQRLLAV